MVLLANEWNAHSSPSIENNDGLIANPRVSCFLFGSQDFLCLCLCLWLYFISFISLLFTVLLAPANAKLLHIYIQAKTNTRTFRRQNDNWPRRAAKIEKRECLSGGCRGFGFPRHMRSAWKAFPTRWHFLPPLRPPTRSARRRMTQFQSWPLTPPNVYIPCTSIITAATHPTPRDLHRGMPMLKSSLVFILVSDSLLKTWWMKLQGRCSFIETYSYHIHMMKTKLWLAHSTPHCATKLRLWNDVLWMKSN